MQKTHILPHKSGEKKPLCIGDELVVQISREAVKTKAPTVTSHLSFTGRYAVLTHGNTRIGVSSKIPRALRDEFKDRLSRMKNEQFGIIIRTNAKGVPFQEVEDEIERLKEEYKKLLNTALSRVAFSRLKSAPPTYISDLKNRIHGRNGRNRHRRKRLVYGNTRILSYRIS